MVSLGSTNDFRWQGCGQPTAVGGQPTIVACQPTPVGPQLTGVAAIETESGRIVFLHCERPCGQWCWAGVELYPQPCWKYEIHACPVQKSVSRSLPLLSATWSCRSCRSFFFFFFCIMNTAGSGQLVRTAVGIEFAAAGGSPTVMGGQWTIFAGRLHRGPGACLLCRFLCFRHSISSVSHLRCSACCQTGTSVAGPLLPLLPMRQ